MRNRLTPTPRKIVIPECPFVNDAEAFTSLGGDVDVSRVGQGRGRDEEHVLREHPFFEGVWDGFVEDAHGGLV